MKKFIVSLVCISSIFMSIIPTSGAYYDYYNRPTQYDSNNPTQYEYSRPIQHISNRRIQTVQNRNVYRNTPQVIYIYQSLPSQPYSTFSAYPGCNAPDIIVGGQQWAACNLVTRTTGASDRSGWFFANDLYETFASYNGLGTRLEWQGKTLPVSNWGDGPCAAGYRIPTRSEWETALYYARLNGTSVAGLLALPQNGAYRGYKDSNSDVRLESRSDVTGAYWSSTVEYNNGGYFPVAVFLGSSYAGYRIDGTYPTYQQNGYSWQYNDVGLSLVGGTSSDLANIRCIKK